MTFRRAFVLVLVMVGFFLVYFLTRQPDEVDPRDQVMRSTVEHLVILDLLEALEYCNGATLHRSHEFSFTCKAIVHRPVPKAPTFEPVSDLHLQAVDFTFTATVPGSRLRHFRYDMGTKQIMGVIPLGRR